MVDILPAKSASSPSPGRRRAVILPARRKRYISWSHIRGGTRMKRRTFVAAAFLYAFLLLPVVPAAAQQKGDNYPSRPVRWVVPYAAGGLPDSIVRIAAPK